MNNEILKEYGELKIAAKRAADRLAELMPLVLKDIVNAGLDKVPTTIGNFSIKKRKVWVYSNEELAASAALKELRANEEADGTATFTEVDQLEFRETPSKE